MSDLSKSEQVCLGNADKLDLKNNYDKQGNQFKVNIHIQDGGTKLNPNVEAFEYVFNEILEYVNDPNNGITEYVFGQEFGKSGITPHIEGGFKTESDRCRVSAMRKAFEWSDCQLSTGTKKAKAFKWNKMLNYCVKECNKVISNVKLPRPLKIIPFDILRPEQQEIVERFKKPCPPIWEERGLLYWFWEPVGGWGKSVVSLWMIDHLNAFVVSGANKDILFGFKQQVDEGNTPDIIVFDIPRCNENHVSYQAIESIKNGFLYSPKYEGGMCRFNPPHVICFSNDQPDLSEMSADRWRVVEL